MTEATLVLPLRRQNGALHTLLGIKKRKIGKGLRNACGGKLEKNDRTIVHCAKRELESESGLRTRLKDFNEVGIIDFWNAGAENFRVHIFTIETFQGEPRDSSEMTDLRWFPWEKLPFYNMMPADRLWLRKVRLGKKFYGRVSYAPDQKYLLAVKWHTY